MAADRGLFIFSVEVLVHIWDLAQAAGVGVEVDPELDHRHLERLRRPGDSIRGPGMYGPAKEAPPEAGEQDQLMAFPGRRVPPCRR